MQDETDYQPLDSKAASGQRKRWQSWALVLAAMLATTLLVLFASTSGARGVVSTTSPFLTSEKNEAKAKAKTLSELLAKKARKKHAERRLQGKTIAQKLKKLHSNRTCRTNDTRTRLLVQQGCSGSTFVYNSAVALARLHGHCLHRGISEPFHPFFGLFRKHKTMEDIYKDITRLRRQGISFAGKSAAEEGIIPVHPIFRKLDLDGMVIVHVYRSNTFDVLCCGINDCFFTKKNPNKSWLRFRGSQSWYNNNYNNTNPGFFKMTKFVSHPKGYAVYLDGKRTELCFERRKRKDVQTQVYINTKDLPSTLELLSNTIIDDRAGLKKLGYMFESIAYEDLAAYEASLKPEDLEKSAQAWKKLMKSWGITPDMKLIENYLKKEQGSRLPQPKNQTVYNYDSVAAVLKGSPLLRMLD